MQSPVGDYVRLNCPALAGVVPHPLVLQSPCGDYPCLNGAEFMRLVDQGVVAIPVWGLSVFEPNTPTPTLTLGCNPRVGIIRV